jgi:4-alpha-glucanotransferase
MNLRRWGLVSGYWGRAGWHQASEATCKAVLEAMGGTPTNSADTQAIRCEGEAANTAPNVDIADGASHLGGMPRYADTLVLRAGETALIDTPSELQLEDGTVLRVEAYLPRDLPLGYHELVARDSGAHRRVIVSPGQCYLPSALRTWGWAIQLYALRSRQSWGIGDLADLEEFARWSSKDLGAGMLLLNPLHAAIPMIPQQESPYYPSSRIYRNPIYLRIEKVPGAELIAPTLAEMRFVASDSGTNNAIDRNLVFSFKIKALEKLWARFGSSREFDSFCSKEGTPLEVYATFCALSEQHGAPWQAWPSEFRDPETVEVRRFAEAHRDRIRFHQWLQWLMDEQLRQSSKHLALIGDLAVGIDPSGADAWAWQALFAQGIEIGAPPDEFNSQGQKWGLLPFVPWRLTAAGYEPFIRVVRSALRNMGGLRLDHVMGLFRLFWIPSGCSATDGMYVRYPALDLLDIVSLESHRAKAFIVGEDLGTVEDEVRREIVFRKVMSSRVLWFEKDAPTKYPAQALATVTTHDLPTIAGLWNGSDLKAQIQIGLPANEDSIRALRSKLADLAGVPLTAAVDDVVLRTYAALAKAPSSLLAATLEDALGFERRPNMPGTTSEYPCWRIPLPKSLEEIENDPRPKQIAAVLARST